LLSWFAHSTENAIIPVALSGAVLGCGWEGAETSREATASLRSAALEPARVGVWWDKKTLMLLGGGENQSRSLS